MKFLNRESKQILSTLKRHLPLLLVIIATSCNQSNIDSSNTTATTIQQNPLPSDTTKFISPATLQSYLDSAPSLITNKSNFSKPFDTLTFNKVIAYKFNGNDDDADVIDTNGRFENYVLDQKLLTLNETEEALNLISNPYTFGADYGAGCFMPHLSLVFFNNATLKNRISICLGCTTLTSDIDLPAQNFFKKNKGTDTEYSLSRISENGKRKLKKYIEKIKMQVW